MVCLLGTAGALGIMGGLAFVCGAGRSEVIQLGRNEMLSGWTTGFMTLAQDPVARLLADNDMGKLLALEHFETKTTCLSHVRRLFRAGLVRQFAYALCEPGHPHVAEASGADPETPNLQRVAGSKPGFDCCSKAPSTKWLTPAAMDPAGFSAYADLCTRFGRSPASLFPQRLARVLRARRPRVFGWSADALAARE